MNIRATGISATTPLLAIVIPTLNEEAALPGLLSDLAALSVPHEIVVSDGGSTDDTIGIARTCGAAVVVGPPGRGRQLRSGVAASTSETLCFLHADVRLDAQALGLLEGLALRPSPAAHSFALRIDADGLPYRIIEWGTNLRSRWLRLTFGDQGLVVGRRAYEAAGGHPPIRLMEDVVLARTLRRHPGLRMLDAHVRVSPRRWQRDGPIRRTIRNWSLLARFIAGADPEHLARRYAARSTGDG